MTVLRINANVAAQDQDVVKKAAEFYKTLFDLDPVMDQGWIVTLASGLQAPVQVSVASEGGSGQPVPPLSIEVDDLEFVQCAAERLGVKVEYGPVDEPWGVRRLFVRDPAGTLINVMVHKSRSDRESA